MSRCVGSARSRRGKLKDRSSCSGPSVSKLCRGGSGWFRWHSLGRHTHTVPRRRWCLLVADDRVVVGPVRHRRSIPRSWCAALACCACRVYPVNAGSEGEAVAGGETTGSAGSVEGAVEPGGATTTAVVVVVVLVVAGAVVVVVVVVGAVVASRLRSARSVLPSTSASTERSPATRSGY